MQLNRIHQHCALYLPYYMNFAILDAFDSNFDRLLLLKVVQLFQNTYQLPRA